MLAIVLRAAGWPAIAGLTICADAVGACGALLVHMFVGPALLAASFALLGAAAAFVLEEPASAVVDVTPARRALLTAMRAVALVAPLLGGFVLVAATAGTLPAADVSLALAGNVLLGFAVACVGRLRTGEPGVAASALVVVVLVVAPMFGPVGRWVHTFPDPSRGSGGLSPDAWWLIAAGASLLAIVLAVRSRSGAAGSA